MLNSDFNFMTDTRGSLPDVSEYVGPNLHAATKMTPKKFAHSVLAVFDRLGGASWLLTQAHADPKAFLDLLKRMIPKSVQLDDLQGVQINLIDQFGNTVQIKGGGEATSGNLLESAPPPATPADVTIKDIFS